MSHDKIRAAARKRVAETGEPYAAALRAVVNGHQGGAQIPFPDTGYVLRMSGEIHDWLAGLRDSNPRVARRVAQTLAALMEEGASLGDPLVVPTVGAWPEALAEALSRSYPERLERLTAARRAAAAAATSSKTSRIRPGNWSPRRPSWRAGAVRRWLPAGRKRQHKPQATSPLRSSSR
jgi:hypothetical protein